MEGYSEDFKEGELHQQMMQRILILQAENMALTGSLKMLLETMEHPFAGEWDKMSATAGGEDKVSNKDKSSRVTGGGQVRNINVTIDSYIKGNIITQNQQISNMSPQELDRWLREHFQRLLRDLEEGYGN